MRALACLLFLALLAPAAGAADEIAVSRHDLYTGRNFSNGDPVNVRIAIVEPKKPRALVVLFTGSRGLAQIQLDGSTPNPNFLLRSRLLFADNHLTAVVMGAPGDRLFDAPDASGTIGLGFGFRRTATHADDIQTVIDFLRQRDPRLPVWLVGTSRGSTSVAYATMRLKRRGPQFGPDAIALTSTIVIPVPPASTPLDPGNDSLLDLQGGSPPFSLSEIRVPTLVVHHVQDECFLTPYAGVKPLRRALSSVDELEVLAFRGGGPVTGDPCDAMHYHGYIGIEEKVVDKMSRWIREVSHDLRHHGPRGDDDNEDGERDD